MNISRLYPIGYESQPPILKFHDQREGEAILCIGLNGGPKFKHNEAFSLQVTTDDQADTNRLWNAIIGHGGQASVCG